MDIHKIAAHLRAQNRLNLRRTGVPCLALRPEESWKELSSSRDNIAGLIIKVTGAVDQGTETMEMTWCLFRTDLRLYREKFFGLGLLRSAKTAGQSLIDAAGAPWARADSYTRTI